MKWKTQAIYFSRRPSIFDSVLKLNGQDIPFPFSLHPMTRMARAEVLDPTSTRSKSKLLYDWQFTANQFVSASSPLRLTTRDFCPQPSPCGKSLCNIISDEKMGLSLMNMTGLSPSVPIALIAFYWKFSLLHYIQVLCQYMLCKAVHVYLTYLILQHQLSHKQL
jgi:hypothetical protein